MAAGNLFTCWLISSMNLGENRAGIPYAYVKCDELNQEQKVSHAMKQIIPTLCSHHAYVCHSVEDNSKASSLFCSLQ